jgi:hypothetical protein
VPESDRPLDLLHAVRDVGVAPLRVDALRAQVAKAVGREIELEATRPAVAGRRAHRRGPRPTFGAFASALSVVIAIAIAATAITLLSRGRDRTQSSGPAAGQLTAKLAVLRRPQTEADMLPGGLHIKSPLSPEGDVIPRLTRLVRTLPDARLYLVVTMWSPDSVWSQRLGDQVAIVEVSGTHATESMPVPAADLTNANDVSAVSPTRQQAPSTPGLYYVGVVPDGVARVRWTFANGVANGQFQAGPSVDASVADNVAIIQARSDTTPPIFRAPPILRGAWYAPDGHRLPTSNRALLAAQAAQNAAQRQQAIRSVSKQIYHADPSLLAAFSVFAITTPTGVKTGAGDIISHPTRSSLPLDVVQLSPRAVRLFQLDFTQVREVITPSGVHLYIIPGRQGLCLSTEGGTGCGLLPQAETQGISLTGGSLGISRTYRLVPKTINSITIRTSTGRHAIPVPDGIYVSPSRRSRQSPLPRCPQRVAPCKPPGAKHP